MGVDTMGTGRIKGTFVAGCCLPRLPCTFTVTHEQPSEKGQDSDVRSPQKA